MAKLKLREGTKYPFKHLDKVGSNFTVTAEKKNVTAALAMFKKQNAIDCDVVAYENGTIKVTRTQ